MRKKELEREVLQEELQREVTRLHDVKSEFLVKKKEYLRFLDGGSPQCSGSGNALQILHLAIASTVLLAFPNLQGILWAQVVQLYWGVQSCLMRF